MSCAQGTGRAPACLLHCLRAAPPHLAPQQGAVELSIAPGRTATTVRPHQLLHGLVELLATAVFLAARLNAGSGFGTSGFQCAHSDHQKDSAAVTAPTSQYPIVCVRLRICDVDRVPARTQPKFQSSSL